MSSSFKICIQCTYGVSDRLDRVQISIYISKDNLNQKINSRRDFKTKIPRKVSANWAFYVYQVGRLTLSNISIRDLVLSSNSCMTPAFEHLEAEVIFFR